MAVPVGQRCKSARPNYSRIADTGIHFVNLTIDDLGSATFVQGQGSKALRNRQVQSNRCDRPGSATAAEVHRSTLSFAPYRFGLDNNNDATSDVGFYVRAQSASSMSSLLTIDSLESIDEEMRNSSGVYHRTLRPYRPNKSHQYLTPTELRDSTVMETDLCLGQPTRTTLLRARKRGKSVPPLSRSSNSGSLCCVKSSQEKLTGNTVLYGPVTNLLSTMIPPGESLHGFLSGARYNRFDCIDAKDYLSSRSTKSFTTQLPKTASKNVMVDGAKNDVNQIRVQPSPINDSYQEEQLPFIKTEQSSTPTNADYVSLSHDIRLAWDDNNSSSDNSDENTVTTGQYYRPGPIKQIMRPSSHSVMKSNSFHDSTLGGIRGVSLNLQFGSKMDQNGHRGIKVGPNLRPSTGNGNQNQRNGSVMRPGYWAHNSSLYDANQADVNAQDFDVVSVHQSIDRLKSAASRSGREGIQTSMSVEELGSSLCSGFDVPQNRVRPRTAKVRRSQSYLEMMDKEEEEEESKFIANNQISSADSDRDIDGFRPNHSGSLDDDERLRYKYKSGGFFVTENGHPVGHDNAIFDEATTGRSVDKSADEEVNDNCSNF